MVFETRHAIDFHFIYSEAPGLGAQVPEYLSALKYKRVWMQI